MKKIFLTALACLLVGCISSQKKQQTSGYIYIPDRTVAQQQPIIVTPDQVTKFLNEPVVLVKYNTSLYSGPSFSNNSLNSLVGGQSISLLGEYQDWYQAKDSTGCVGWIAKKWVSDPAEIKQPEKQVEIA
ncbi:MAG: SH3 domain-containing protein, partial [Proteobacteria bacterium]|nr:SH3 domain-containing protein [Pseudomonadota bacterium]